MSLAVGETHGNDVPDKFPTPQGLNLVCRRHKGFDPVGVGNLRVGVPIRGFHPRLMILIPFGEPGCGPKPRFMRRSQ